MGPVHSLDDLFSLIRRRFWLMLGVTLAGILASVVYAKTRPDTYEAAAVIQVELPTVTADASQPANSAAAQLVQAIEQRLATRDNLMVVIGRHGLFRDLTAVPDDKKVTMLRAAVEFQSVAATGQSFGATAISAIVVDVKLGDGELAARVANDFAQEILDQSSAGQRDRARETADFFTGEEARVWQQLGQLEDEIAAYKNANSDSLPAITEAHRNELVSLESDLRAFDSDLDALGSELATINAKPTLREIDRRAQTDIALKIEAGETQKSRLTQRRNEVEATLAEAPEVERVLSSYDRKLRQLQSQYDVITAKLAEAKTTQQLAERRQSGRFALLERAVAPDYPMGSGGKTLVIMGSFASLALALAMALDALHPVVRTAAQMERLLGLRPVVNIPEIGSRQVQGNRIYRMLDDPDRPIFGLPRFAVVTVVVALVLIALAALVS